MDAQTARLLAYRDLMVENLTRLRHHLDALRAELDSFGQRAGEAGANGESSAARGVVEVKTGEPSRS